MSDETTTQEKVKTEGTKGPYISVSTEKLPKIKKALDEGNIRYHISPGIEVRSETDATKVEYIVEFGFGADVPRIQSILDGLKP